MFSFVWPLALVIFSEIIYQICAKSVPGDMNPFASLIITYLVAAITAAILFFTLGGKADFKKEVRKTNVTPFILGAMINGLEAGWIYAYKAGWQVSTGFIVQSAFMAVGLLFVGFLLYHEALTRNKVVGVIICIIGLVFINFPG